MNPYCPDCKCKNMIAYREVQYQCRDCLRIMDMDEFLVWQQRMIASMNNRRYSE